MKNYKGKIVAKDRVFDGYLTIENGNITYVGEKIPQGQIIDCGDKYITPGLIDIHCHASLKYSAVENPFEVADFHLSHGVTSMLLSIYKDVLHQKILECLEKVKECIKTKRNIVGAHLEGPYINGNLGYSAGKRESIVPDKEVYSQYIETGVVKQWTFAPELNGVIPVIKEVSVMGIVPALGHSEATYSQVKSAYDNGAKIVTHIFDATGLTDNAEFAGTKDLSFDNAVMLMDDMYYEVICDGEWVHVRKEMLDLLIKTVGIDRVVAITDLDICDADDDGRDIAVANGQLLGTKLTLDKVVRNLFVAGYKVSDIFKMVALNPAKAINLFDRGELAVGKRADLCLFDEKMKFIKVL